MTDSTAGIARKKQVQARQIEILFQHASLVLAANLLVGTSVAWFLWSTVEHRLLFNWWQCVVATAVFRIVLVAGYRRRHASTSFPWQRIMTLATIVSGIVWGSAGILFFKLEISAALLFVTVVLAGMTAGSMASHFSWPPAQFGYAIPAMAPIALRYLVEGGELWPLGAMCLVYLAVMLGFARQIFRTVAASIRLQIEKQELVQRLHEEKLVSEEARSHAEEANAAKSKFLAAASHDLRQPLHAVNLLIEALRHEQNPAKATQVVEYLGTSAKSLEDLLNELLDISKVEAGMIHARPGTFRLQAIFDSLDRELRPIADEKGIELGFVATQVAVRSDPHLLSRILRNIVTNAIRYTERGAVLIGCRRKADGIAISVYDTGPGIAPEHHEAIFREFHQLGNPERDRRKGLGLGLAIVDGLCRILGHPLGLRSQLGRGSVFFVHVPVAPVEELNHATVIEMPACDLHGWPVLVVDDEPAVCQAMKEILDRWGCPSIIAESAEDALARLAEESFEPAVVVADFRLRGGRTGAEAIAEIRRALGRPVPGLIVTGDTAPERLREASASGFLLLHKPVQPAQLRVALTSLRSASEAVTDGISGRAVQARTSPSVDGPFS